MLRSLVFLSALAVSGCSLFAGEAEVSFVVSVPNDSQDDLDVSAAVDGRTVPLSVQETTGRSYDSELTSVSTGSTTVSCTLTRDSASTRGAVTLDLQEGFRYPIHCAVAAQNPANLCFGCAGSKAFPLDARLGLDEGLSLYLVWSVVDPDNPVLY